MRALVIAGIVAGLGVSSATAEDRAMALGVVTCSQSTCHSAEKPWPNSSVTQKEYVTWKAMDPHAQSYETLKTPAARRISTGLGQGAATENGLCLGCHSYNPPESMTEPTFDHTVGIACEGCHGPASNWLGVHQAGLYYYQRNVDEGMYPTTDAVKRAELCLSCHIGTAEKFVTHQMYTLGHPRLPFELGFYSWFNEGTPGSVSNYAHFEVDDDYLQRKPWPFGVRVWAIGQAVQAREFLELLTDPRVGDRGLFPEFAFFDCQSCHAAQLSGEGVPQTLGLPRLNDANLFFVEQAARLVDPRLAGRIRADIQRMRWAGGQGWGQILAAAKQMKGGLVQLVDALDRHRFSADDTRRVLNAIGEASRTGVFRNYLSAEQAVLATGSLIDELIRLDELDPVEAALAEEAVSLGLASFVSAEYFRDAQLRSALRDAAAIATN